MYFDRLLTFGPDTSAFQTGKGAKLPLPPLANEELNWDQRPEDELRAHTRIIAHAIRRVNEAVSSRDQSLCRAVLRHAFESGRIPALAPDFIEHCGGQATNREALFGASIRASCKIVDMT
jgi:hypothetical protein